MESCRQIFESLLFINCTPKPFVYFVRERDAREIQAAILKSGERTGQPIYPVLQISVVDSIDSIAGRWKQIRTDHAEELFLTCEVVNCVARAQDRKKSTCALAVFEQNHFVASLMSRWLSWLGCFIEGLSSYSGLKH